MTPREPANAAHEQYTSTSTPTPRPNQSPLCRKNEATGEGIKCHTSNDKGTLRALYVHLCGHDTISSCVYEHPPPPPPSLSTSK